MCLARVVSILDMSHLRCLEMVQMLTGQGFCYSNAHYVCTIVHCTQISAPIACTCVNSVWPLFIRKGNNANANRKTTKTVLSSLAGCFYIIFQSFFPFILISFSPDIAHLMTGNCTTFFYQKFLLLRTKFHVAFHVLNTQSQ